MSEPTKIDPAPVKVDPLYIAAQFERINVTLEFLGKSIDKSNAKADAQDLVINGMSKDIELLKHKMEAIEQAKPKALHPAVLWSTIASAVVSTVAIITVVVNSLN